MKKKIIAFIVVLVLLSSTSAYAVPQDLWNGDSRVVSLFTQDKTTENFDVLQKLIDYIGVTNKDNISGEYNIKSNVLIRALAEIVGFTYNDDVEINTILLDLKKANILRDSTKATVITLPDLLYAGTRITGWVEPGANENTVYTQAKRAGLMRNITYSDDRNLTGYEAAQLIYNILSINTKASFKYSENYVYLNKTSEEPILKSKYGIILKRGIVTAVFGESTYNTNTLKENEIELDGKVYKFNSSESQADLIGREAVLFIEEENDYVILAEATSNNDVRTINFGEETMFKSSYIECFADDGEEYRIDVSNNTNVIYNGMLVGTYSVDLMSKYFKEGTKITAVDNDKDGDCNYLLVRCWDSFPVLLDAGVTGIVKFAHGRLFEGESYIDLTPEDDNIHVTVLKNGEKEETASIKAGSIISISTNVNKTGHKYILVETHMEQVSGELVSTSDNKYNINGNEYVVAKSYLEAQETVSGVNKPVPGQICTFSVDITKRIISAEMSPEYSFGYIVSVTGKSGINPTCKLKIFTSNGTMEEISVAEKLKLHDDISQTGRNIEPYDFAQYVAAKGDENEDGDYRCLIQYKLNDANEIVKVWFPIDNTGATEYGKSGYQFTKDVVNSSYVTYSSGVVKDSFWGGSTILFAIPQEKDAIDSRYSIKKPSYHGSRWTQASEFYCVDDFNNITAAVMHMPDTSNIDNYSALMVVDKVVSSLVGESGELGYKIYGTVNGEAASHYASENLESLACNSGWIEGVKLTELKFGDIIQVYKADDKVQLFRILYRISAGEDYIKNSDGGSKDSGQLAITTASFVTQKGNAFKLSQTMSGTTKTFFKFFSVSATANIIDTKTQKVTRTTVADLVPGDKIVIYSKRKAVQRVYIIR